MLNRKTYFIREHVGILKLSNTYDILDPETKTMLGVAQEDVPFWVHLLRLAVNKQFLPTAVVVREGGNENALGPVLFQIKRSFNIGFRTKIDILNTNGEVVGWFQKKALSFGGAFFVFDAAGTQVAKVGGDWKGWEFRFEDLQGKSLGLVSKRWSGIGKELFTTADNYILSLEEVNPAMAILLLAAGLAIDTVFKER